MSRERIPEEKAWTLRFGVWLEARRERRGLTQEELVDRLFGAGQQAVSKYELGISAPTAFHLIALISELRIDPIELLIDLGPDPARLTYQADERSPPRLVEMDAPVTPALPTQVDEELEALLALLDQLERRRVADFVRQLIRGR